MKRFVLVVVAAALVAFAIWFSVRLSRAHATAAVASLLPADTIYVAHVPDFETARAQWHQTDIYQLWREPEVQEFLRKPLAEVPQSAHFSQQIADLEHLHAKDLFLGIGGSDGVAGTKVICGFRFPGSEQDAEKIIGQWRTNFAQGASSAPDETTEYQHHHIQIAHRADHSIATAYDGEWFLAANDLDYLQRGIDRVDHRLPSNDTLAADKTFADAAKEMPGNYAVFSYGRADLALQKWAPLLTTSNPRPNEPVPIYRQVHAVCAAVSFDKGKIRDSLFIVMPKLAEAGPLTRSSLSLGTKDSFLYLAGFLNLAKSGAWPSSSTPAARPAIGFMQQFMSAISSSGVSLDEWNTAFSPEIGLVGDWAASTRLPSVLATLSVKNSQAAMNVVTKLTAVNQGATWVQDEKNGVRYFSLRTVGMFSFAPVFALLDRMLIAGTNFEAVQTAVEHRAKEKSELSASEIFRAAESAVPAPQQAFMYLDPALLYTRLDAALRPMLIMAAAFAPAVSQHVDLSKWPDAQTITKHLSPIVMSQSYHKDGYLTESVGPMTMLQAAFGSAILSGGAAWLYQSQTHGTFLPGFHPKPTGLPVLPQPSPSPSDTP